MSSVKRAATQQDLLAIAGDEFGPTVARTSCLRETGNPDEVSEFFSISD